MISKNYIPNWGLSEAVREVMQNFLDYGEYEYDIQSSDTKDYIKISNTWEPENLNFLIIGESEKTNNNRGKYGEGLKMSALVLLRNGFDLRIETASTVAQFKLCNNGKETVDTLGVEIGNITISTYTDFEVYMILPKGFFTDFLANMIQPVDIIHHVEGYGSIVAKPKGNIYVGGLYVCNLKGFNYAYDFYPNKVPLDRDRSVPRDFDVKWCAGKIQETYSEFDTSGRTVDTVYSTPSTPDIYRPTIRNGEVTFMTKREVVDTETNKIEVKEIEVSSNFKDKLIDSGWFNKTIFKMKQFLSKSLSLDVLAYNFRKKYCRSDAMKKDFDIILVKMGIEPPDDSNLPF